ncbi:MAG: hypothetical protein Kilf2KO_16800 [Rhodospirillales bacterium]
MMKSLFGAAVAALLLAAAGSDAEANCDPGKPGSELSGEEAEALYKCISASLVEGYKKGDKRWIPKDFVDDYRSWTLASRFPAASGFHGGRFLMTYVNPTGADSYMEYKEENVVIPAGTRLAKESFSVTDAGKLRKGPLFMMEKMPFGTSPRTNDWYYMMVSPEGAPLAVNVYTACSECHQGNFGYQGDLGYPVPEARVHKR